MAPKQENPRARRLGEQIQRELGEMLRRQVKDGRIGNVTVTAVNVTGDLRMATVYYLIFGKSGADPKVQRGLESAANFLRNALSKSLMIRYTPTLKFELDTSIEHGVRLTQLIDSVTKAQHGAATPGAPTPGVATPGVATPGVATPGVATPDDVLPDDAHDHVIDEG